MSDQYGAPHGPLCKACGEPERDDECRYCEWCGLDAGFNSDDPHCETNNGDRLCDFCWHGGTRP